MFIGLIINIKKEIPFPDEVTMTITDNLVGYH